MSQVTKLFASSGRIEHPAVRAIRDRMGPLDEAHAQALEFLKQQLDVELIGPLLARKLLDAAGNQLATAEQLRGFIFGMYLAMAFHQQHA